MELLDSNNDDGELIINGLTIYQDRLRHFAVDFLIISILCLLIFFYIVKANFVLGPGGKWMIFNWLSVYFLYYFILEYFFGLTVGKFLNKTRVFNLNEEKPNSLQILIRMVVRLIPLQHSFIRLPYQRTLHDILSKTYVMRIK